MIKSPVRAAGIDLGTVRVGLALADELGIMAHPRPFLDGRDEKKLVARLTALAREERITRFIVGLPRRLDGREGSAARRARRFAAELARQSGVEVELLDERLTTREAAGRLRQRGLDARASRSVVDSAAAAILLQGWLDRERVSSP